MVEIISRRDGSRREDDGLRRLISDNRATITRLADHLSQGGYSASKTPRPAPQAKGLIIHDLGPGRAPEEPCPAVRISINGRVILVDENSSRQMHHLGEIRTRQGCDVFVLATAANGFFGPLESEIAERLQDLDGRAVAGEDGENALADEIRVRMGMA